MWAAHLAVRQKVPAFTPPATPDKEPWVRATLYGEFLVHIAFLGAVITAIRNRIPLLKDPGYADDGTLGIGSRQAPNQAGPRWTEILGITAEFGLYIAIWAWIYGLFG